MSIFQTVVKKDWQVPVKSTNENKLRFDAIQKKLASLSPNASLELSTLLEKELEKILNKAEKEIKALEDKKPSETSNKPSSELEIEDESFQSQPAE